MLDRSKAPEFVEIEGVALYKPKEIQLQNGVKIFIFHSASQPLVKAEFVFNNIYDASENLLVHMAMQSLIKDGTKLSSSAEIAEKIDAIGAYLIPEYSFDHSSVSLYTLNKYAVESFPILQDVLFNATFPQKEFDVFIKNCKQNLQISLERNEVVAKRRFYNEVFGENRYGMLMTDEKLDELKPEQITGLYRQQIRPENCTIFVSGNVTDEVLSILMSRFEGDWSKTGGMGESNIPIVDLSPSGKIIEMKADSVQSAIRIGGQSIRRADADYPKLQFVNTLFGGYFGSRLMQNIREDKGYTYGISSSMASFRYTGMLSIMTQVGVDVVEPSLKEIKFESEKLRQELAKEEELVLVRNYILGSFLGSLESIFSHADKFKSVYLIGLDLTFYDRYIDDIKSIDARTVQQLANKYLDVEKMLTVIV